VTYTRESGDTGCNKGESPGGTAAGSRQGAAPAVKRPILEYYGRTSHGMAWPILEYYGRTSHGILWPILEYYGRTSHGMACSLASDPNQCQIRQKDLDRSKRLGQRLGRARALSPRRAGGGRRGPARRKWSKHADLVKHAETGQIVQIWSNMQKSVKCKKMGKARKPAGQTSWSNQLVKSAGQTSR
jgi:hypothetical protein